jgi:queuine tRNA-ribosyltransferase
MFKLTSTKGRARHGYIQTPHGRVTTPFYMPDATRGFVRLSTPSELRQAGAEALVVNTFHLLLQPGMEIIRKAGGIHKFMGWDSLLASDSGGYQVFSLIHRNAKLGKIDDEKVTFKSPLNGSWHELSPEKSIQIQFDLGTDIMVCLDDCPPNEWERPALAKAVERTIAWAKRCRVEFDNQCKKRKLTGADKPILTAVIQGGEDLELRRVCADGLKAIGFDAYGFGGCHVDGQGRLLTKVLKTVADLIPENALRFALGIGKLSDIKAAHALGWDIFDCVIPTREGRHGRLLSLRRAGKGLTPAEINISNAKFKNDHHPINSDSAFPELRIARREFMHHLFKLDEPLGSRLASLNNLETYYRWLEALRKK